MLHQIPPPQYLNLKHSGEVAKNWKLWKEKYNNYFVILRLDRETAELQLAIFKHTIGDDALKVIKTFSYAVGEARWRSIVLAKSMRFMKEIVSTRRKSFLYNKWILSLLN